MVAHHVSPESKVMKTAQNRRDEPRNDRPPPVRGTPADPGPGGPAIPGGEGPDGRPAPVNPQGQEARHDEAERVQDRLDQANATARPKAERGTDMTHGNIDRAVQYIRSAMSRGREAWDQNDGRENEAARRELDNALRELGQSV